MFVDYMTTASPPLLLTADQGLCPESNHRPSSTGPYPLDFLAESPPMETKTMESVLKELVLTMSSTASLMALIASTAMRGISVVRGVSEEISGMSCSLDRRSGQPS